MRLASVQRFDSDFSSPDKHLRGVRLLTPLDLRGNSLPGIYLGEEGEELPATKGA
jgi:hypothetical protein